MDEITTLIVDDEPSGRLALRNLLRQFCPEVRILGEAAEVEGAVSEIRKLNPDLVFLDVELRPGNAFEILDALTPIKFGVIFCTAYEQYALRAFEFSALHYLTKPINPLHLQEAVNRFRNSNDSTHERLEMLSRSLQQNEYKKIALPTRDGFLFVEIETVVRLEGEGSYTRFHFEKEKPVLVSRRLGYYEGLLQEHLFQRVHQSHLVNLRYLSRYTKGKGGILELTDGTEVRVSEGMRKAFIARLQELGVD